MEELNSVRGLLVKLQAVFELPKRLRAAIEQGSLELAAEKYAEAANLLQQYGHKVAHAGPLAAEAAAWNHKLLILLLFGTLQIQLMKRSKLQGAFRRVNAEVQGCVREMTAVLKERLVTQKDSAAECIKLIRMLGEPIESLQVMTHATPY